MNDILAKANRNDGIRVPEGYFEDFAARMSGQLPTIPMEQPAPKVLPRSIWQKIRPYVYMAAMFMGVWCMMKTFDLMRPSSAADQTPPALAAAILDHEQYVGEYITDEGALDDYQLMESLYDEGVTPAMLDFTPDSDDSLSTTI